MLDRAGLHVHEIYPTTVSTFQLSEPFKFTRLKFLYTLRFLVLDVLLFKGFIIILNFIVRVHAYRTRSHSTSS